MVKNMNGDEIFERMELTRTALRESFSTRAGSTLSTRVAIQTRGYFVNLSWK